MLFLKKQTMLQNLGSSYSNVGWKLKFLLQETQFTENWHVFYIFLLQIVGNF